MAETTSSSFPPLSNRTQQALKRGADSPLSTALFKTFGNQWTSENPDGVVNAGLAENSLMHECSFSLSIPPLTLPRRTYVPYFTLKGCKSFGRGPES